MNRKLSVIIPAYREGAKIVGNIKELERELKKLDRPYEIVLVIDGCRDTYDAAKHLASDTVKIYYYEHNVGKGYALKYGTNRITGDLVTFIDADMSIDPKQIDSFIKLLDKEDADIVVGSKRHPKSLVKYPSFRRFQSFCYQVLIALLFNLNVRDTQSGLKLFKRDVLTKVIPRVLVRAYAFDVELLAVAHRLGYTNVVEAPITIKEQFSTTTNLRAAWRALFDTAAIFYRLRILKYYDQEHIFIEKAKTEPFVSIVIPVKSINSYIEESVVHLKKLAYEHFEVLIFPDEDKSGHVWPEFVRIVPTGPIGPAEKRDLSIKLAKGEILAFIDDDAFPRPDWLINAVHHFTKPEVAAVGGPAVTAASDNIWQKASGAVFESYLGGGGVTYRYLPRTLREVDDFPSVNLFVRKDVFTEVGGFDCAYYPGEDTKLCLEIVKLGKRIIYDPDVTVWHHRRPLFKAHLKQISNYAMHRGFFVKKHPETSLRVSYFLPTIFITGLVAGLIASFYSRIIMVVYVAVILLYAAIASASGLWTAIVKQNAVFLLLVPPGIFLTHLVYGAYFLKGLLSRSVK